MIESILSIFVKNSQQSLQKKRPSGNLNFEESLHKQEKLMQQKKPAQFGEKFVQHTDEEQGYLDEEETSEKETEDVERDDEVAVEEDNAPVEAKNTSVEDAPVEVGVAPVENPLTLEVIADTLKLDKRDLENLIKVVEEGDMPLVEKKLAGIVAILNKEPVKSVKKLLTNLKKALKGGDLKEIKSAISKVLKSDVAPAALKAVKPEILKEDFKLQVDSSLESDKGPKLEDLGEIAKSIKKFTVKADHAKDVKFFHENYKMKGDDAKQVKFTQAETMPDFSEKQSKGGFGKDGFGKKGEAPQFIKKMKSALKMKSGEKPEPVNTFDAPTAKTGAQTKLSFINKMVNGKFVQQMVEKIQNMVSNRTTITGSVDFKSVEFGEMKLAAEVVGSKLMVKLSSSGQSVNNEILSLKDDLMSELKSLGFDEVDIDFGNDARDSNGKNPFEEEIQKRLHKDVVKLPGDYLADLGKIDEWLKSYEEVG